MGPPLPSSSPFFRINQTVISAIPANQPSTTEIPAFVSAQVLATAPRVNNGMTILTVAAPANIKKAAVLINTGMVSTVVANAKQSSVPCYSSRTPTIANANRF